jgi:hypothetical protein
VIAVLTAEGPVEAATQPTADQPGSYCGTEIIVSVVVYLLLTVAVFAILGVVLKLVEGL